VKIEELVSEEEVPVKKRIAYEGARNYPPQVVAPAKSLVNPMHVSCMSLCVPKVFRDPPKIFHKLKVLHTLDQQDSHCSWNCTR